MNRKIYAASLYLLFLAMGSPSTEAQSIGDIILRPVVTVTEKGDDYFNKGVSLYSKKQYAAALMVFEKAMLKGAIIEEYKDVIEFLQVMSRAKMMKNNTLLLLESYIESSNNPTLKSNAMLTAAVKLMDMGDFSSANEILKGVSYNNLDRRSRYIYDFSNGYIKLHSGDSENAYTDLLKCIDEKSPKKDIAQYYMAYIDYINGDLEKSFALFEKLSQNPNYAETNLYILQIKFMQRDFNFVIEQGQGVLNMNLNNKINAEVIRLIGESYFNTGNYTLTIENILKYESLDGKMTRELYYQMGYSYYMQNMYKKSISQFIKILEGDDALTQNAYYHLADAYLKTGNKSGAIQAFSMASSFPFELKMAEDALYNYARLTYESVANNLYSTKIDVLKKYVSLYPKGNRANEIRSYLLTLYLNSSNFDAAMGELSKVNNPNNDIKQAVQRLCYQKGTEHFNNGNYVESIKLFDKSLSYPISPKYVALCSFWKAESMFKQGIYDYRVINLYNDYLRVAQPSMREFKMSHYNIAYVYYNNEQWSQAIASFEKFLKYYETQDGYLEDAYLRLGDAMFVTKQYEAAQLYYKKSSAVGVLNPDYADFQRAITEGIMGRNDLKIKTLKYISERGTSKFTDQSTIELGKTYIKTGDFKQGIKVLEKMTKKSKASTLLPAAFLELGLAYVNSGNNTEALKRYKTLVSTYPKSSEAKDALVAIKSVYISLGEVETYFTYIESLGSQNVINISEKESLTYDALQRQFIAGNYAKVISLSKLYNKEYENGVHSTDVAYYLSEALVKTNSDLALAQVEYLISLPQNQYTIEALKNAVKLYAKKSMTDKQHNALIQIYEISLNQSEKKETLETLMQLAVNSDDIKLMNTSCKMVFSDKNASEKSTSLAYFAKGKEAYLKGDSKTLIDNMNKVTLPMSRAEGVQAKYLIADAYLKLGDLANCEKHVVAFTGIETSHQYWIARGFILYGDLFVKKGDLFQAKATFQSILEGYDKENDGIKDTVTKRLEILSSQERTKSSKRLGNESEKENK